MAQNSVNITTEENIVTVVEPSSTSITIIQNTDKSQVSSTTEVANNTSITQDVSVLTLDNNPNVVNVLTADPAINEVFVTQPSTTVIEVLTGPIGASGQNGSTQPFSLIGGNNWSTTSSIFITGSFTVSSSNTFTNIGPTIFSGSITIVDDIFLIKNNNVPVFTVSQSGVVVLATQSAQLTSSAPNGGIYFTSSSFFVGLD